MNLKILSSLTKQLRSNSLIIGTHNGIFHSDDIVACALLCLLYSDKQIRILRTRDAEMLAQCIITWGARSHSVTWIYAWILLSLGQSGLGACTWHYNT